MSTYTSESYKIRKLDTYMDQTAVANLIEKSFGSYIDPDGKAYLQRIREAAQNRKKIQWLKGANEMLSYPLAGFVCETHGGDIVGNISIIPFERNGKWIYLIANVAVDDQWRRKGIAKQLTTHALNHLSRQGVETVWLQVRDDNEPAINLYKSFGFQEFSCRTTWLKSTDIGKPDWKIPELTSVSKRKSRHWLQHAQYLHRTFPQDVAWNLNLQIREFAPGILSAVKSSMQISDLEHYEVMYNQQIIGFASWQARKLYADNIWFACDQTYEYESSLALLLTIERQIRNTQRPLMINYPANRNQAGFTKAGYTPINTLIWMKRPVWRMNKLGG